MSLKSQADSTIVHEGRTENEELFSSSLAILCIVAIVFHVTAPWQAKSKIGPQLAESFIFMTINTFN